MPLPDVDVVMPVYNAETYVCESVQSILRQSFESFRLICVDDGCTDGSSEILDRLAAEDRRIEVLRQENAGLVGALNAGLSKCTAPLIARMDADDIAMPDRFQRQVEFLQADPKVFAVGTAILEMDTDSEPLAIVQNPLEHEQIDAGLMQMRSGLAHPSVMMRRRAVQSLGGYRAEFEWVEDYDLWLRMSEHGRLANLPEVLLCYRQHASSGTWRVGESRVQRAIAALREAYERRGLLVPHGFEQRYLKVRSPGGPGKWARKASRQGHWGIACKHLRKLWQEAPASSLTWRMTLEVAARSTTHLLFGRKTALPEIPRYRDAA
ncbi:MAG: glycosyltransferase [Planctomycetales bacterium]|nr:glycosyltransferase [Planctomycetales bacterium]